MPKEFWNCFQLFLGQSKLPSFLIELLKITGYDSPISIELIDEEKICEIENFIENNFGCTSDLLKSTVYENREVFRFLPGHVTLLLGLKKYAKTFLEIGFKKRKNTKQQNHVLGRELPQESPDELDTINEEVEVPSEDELSKLTDTLITKIKVFCRKQDIETENITSQCISEQLQVIINTNGGNVFKCVFSCHCGVRIPCIHNKYWQVANLEKHLKKHRTRRPNPAIAEKLNQILQSNP